MVAALRMDSVALLPSFVGVLDLKTGVIVVTLFGLLNKVAGVYGMMAVFTGGSWLQLSYYSYSIVMIGVFLWGLKRVSGEIPSASLLYSHLFLLDHLVSTIYTTIFALTWYLYTPHDGRRVANSDAQRGMMGAIVNGSAADDLERIQAAEGIWRDERGVSAALLLGCWFIKVYFILCLYSFALHLRRGSYRSLPLSQLAEPQPKGTRSPPSSLSRYHHRRRHRRSSSSPDSVENARPYFQSKTGGRKRSKDSGIVINDDEESHESHGEYYDGNDYVEGESSEESFEESETDVRETIRMTTLHLWNGWKSGSNNIG